MTGSRIAGWLLCLACTPIAASAQETASQRYLLRVPARATVTAPPAAVIVHDGTDSAQAFPGQPWNVWGTFPSGLTVDFTADRPFTHVGNTSALRDARLRITLSSTSGPAAWTVEVAADRTDHTNGRMQAVTRASTNAPGRATIDVGVAFITDDYGALPAGDYELTVTATVSPHP